MVERSGTVSSVLVKNNCHTNNPIVINSNARPAPPRMIHWLIPPDSPPDGFFVPIVLFGGGGGGGGGGGVAQFGVKAGCG